MYLSPDRIVQQRTVRAHSVTWQVAIHATPGATPELHPPFEVAVTETGYDGHRRVLDERYAVDLADAVRWANHLLGDPNIIPPDARRGTPAFAPPPAPAITEDDAAPAAALSEVLFA